MPILVEGWLKNKSTSVNTIHAKRTSKTYSKRNRRKFGSILTNKSGIFVLQETKVPLTAKFALEEAIKAEKGSRGIVSYLFNLSVRWDGWSKPRPGRFAPRKEPVPIHPIGGWMGVRTGLNGYGKYRHHRDSIPGPSSP
jgi:hypothetical protein